MLASDSDQSGPYPRLNPDSNIWLYISWDPSAPPSETEIAVSIIVKNLPPYTVAKLAQFYVQGGEYYYEIIYSGEMLASPDVHDQSIHVPYLTGRPKYVHARYSEHPEVQRATTVAL